MSFRRAYGYDQALTADSYLLITVDRHDRIRRTLDTRAVHTNCHVQLDL